MRYLLLGIIFLPSIGVGLADTLLGSAWPTMYTEFLVPVSYAGAVSMTISVGRILANLQSGRLAGRFGTGVMTAVSVGVTAAAMFGSSASHSFLALCLWALPYGLGIGTMDASMNNYVALHYESRYMSWFHCMWGIGATLGPYLMGRALAGGGGWNAGYRWTGLIQAILTVILLASLPLWQDRQRAAADSTARRDGTLTLGQILRIPCGKTVMVMFFCYCAMEQTAGLWISSYLALHVGMPADTAAWFASLFFAGITVGRALSGFLTIRLQDEQMVRLGQCIAAAGILLVLLPLGEYAALAGLALVGLGCAPIYPCLIHATPARFGAENSHSIIGVQIASAHVGSCLMPPLFGLIAEHVSISLYPLYLLVLLAVMAVMHERILRHGGKTLAEPADGIWPVSGMSPDERK